MFKVPEQFRAKQAEASAISNGLQKLSPKDGYFTIPYNNHMLIVISSDWAKTDEFDVPFEHVSVHATSKHGAVKYIPSWEEMSYIKSLFWDDEDVVIQLHVGKSNHINIHHYTLHLWRNINQVIELPPHYTV